MRVGVHLVGRRSQERIDDEIDLVINSEDAKTMVRHQWKAVELYEQHDNKIQRESVN